jgi:hypothetical protein
VSASSGSSTRSSCSTSNSGPITLPPRSYSTQSSGLRALFSTRPGTRSSRSCYRSYIPCLLSWSVSRPSSDLSSLRPFRPSARSRDPGIESSLRTQPSTRYRESPRSGMSPPRCSRSWKGSPAKRSVKGQASWCSPKPGRRHTWVGVVWCRNLARRS